MRGKAVFYPVGWDDNGLPTERRVQNYYGVRCDPSLPYDPSFTPPDKPGKQPVSVSRPNFIELCARLTAEDLIPVLEAEAEIELSGITPELIRTLQRMEPFGVGNREPMYHREKPAHPASSQGPQREARKTPPRTDERQSHAL